MAPTSTDRPVTGSATERVSLLRNHPFFCELPPAILERLGAYMKRRSVAKGAIIFEKGDSGIGLIGVLAGAVKISVGSLEGHEVVLNIIREGEVFGEIALLDGRPRTADAAAMTDCELVVIERREFITFLRGEPDVMLKLMEILCDRLRRTSDQVQDVTFLNLSVRLARTLIQLTANTAASGPKGKVTITQSEIGQIVGRSRESVNIQLRAWSRRGWVRLERGSVTVLAADKLAEVAATGSDLDAS
jgi:CRP/FNR family transcriptional regulator, cyclic AMP receptor protein